MPKCDCVFSVVDRFGHFEYHCTIDTIHAGPHYDSEQNYTWGAITGYDPWSKYRQEQEHQKRLKRAESAGKLKLGKWLRK